MMHSAGGAHGRNAACKARKRDSIVRGKKTIRRPLPSCYTNLHLIRPARESSSPNKRTTPLKRARVSHHLNSHPLARASEKKTHVAVFLPPSPAAAPLSGFARFNTFKKSATRVRMRECM